MLDNRPYVNLDVDQPGGHGRVTSYGPVTAGRVELGASLAACGSGAGAGTGTTEADDNAGLAFSACMRAHGLKTFPDPGGPRTNDSGHRIRPPLNSPAAEHAQKVWGNA